MIKLNTMFFTQEDYRKIEKWLLSNSIKDTEFVEASAPLQGNETLAFVQKGKNVKVSLKDLIDQIFLLGVSDLINITEKYGESYISLSQAIELIPYRSRKIGQVVTFLDDTGKWTMFQFQGTRKNQWGTLSLWVNLTNIEIPSIGNTSNRPTSAPIGFCYYDTTIAKPIWVKNISENGVTWIDATGATV